MRCRLWGRTCGGGAMGCHCVLSVIFCGLTRGMVSPRFLFVCSVFVFSFSNRRLILQMRLTTSERTGQLWRESGTLLCMYLRLGIEGCFSGWMELNGGNHSESGKTWAEMGLGRLEEAPDYAWCAGTWYGLGSLALACLSA
ncbi:uncharacterized protein J3D65DRAFT_339005 [Phyllosticta citribraziliensis]|uniref:Uncharacterized protein n=1 Tax=Phyllosticta citribraziliensis TaxID=989973 RepID=A0ABR1LX27_9PEZI